MRPKAPVYTLYLFLLFFGFSSAIYPNPIQYTAIVRHWIQELETIHVFRKKPTPETWKQTAKKFALAIDPTHRFFLKSDIQEFFDWAQKIPTQIKTRNIQFPFQVYERYQRRRRVVERLLEQLIRDNRNNWAIGSRPRTRQTFVSSMGQLERLWKKTFRWQLRHTRDPEKLRAYFKGQLGVERPEQVRPLSILAAFCHALGKVYDPHTSYSYARASEPAPEQQTVTWDVLRLSHWRIREPLSIGVLELLSFYNSKEAGKGAFIDLKNSLQYLVSHEGIDALILDLRGNIGGSLNELMQLAGLFLGKSPVLQVVNPDSTQIIKSSIPCFFDKPLIVLVDYVSGSASEILAAAIQDTGRGIVVGPPSTMGKASMQSPFDINNALGKFIARVTTAQVFRLNGRSHQNIGIQPDIEFAEPPYPEDRNYIEKYHPHRLDTPKPIKPVTVQDHNMRRELSWLREQHQARVQQGLPKTSERYILEVSKIAADYVYALSSAIRCSERLPTRRKN